MIKTRTFILEHNQNKYFSSIHYSYFSRLSRHVNKTKIYKSILHRANTNINNLNFKQINFDLLTVFYTVVIYGSINLAAEHLSVSQPAISLSLQKIEKETGCLLFKVTNSTKSVVLTPSGLVVFNYIQRLFQIIEECLDFLNADVSALSLSKINKNCDFKFIKYHPFFNLNKSIYLSSRLKVSIFKMFLSKSRKSLSALNVLNFQFFENKSKFIFFQKKYIPLETLSLLRTKDSTFINFEIDKYQSLKNSNSQIFYSLYSDNLIEIQTIQALKISIDMKISDLICWGSEI